MSNKENMNFALKIFKHQDQRDDYSFEYLSDNENGMETIYYLFNTSLINIYRESLLYARNVSTWVAQ